MTLRRDSDVVAAHGSVTRTPAPLSSSQLARLYSAEQGPDFSNYTAGTAQQWSTVHGFGTKVDLPMLTKIFRRELLLLGDVCRGARGLVRVALQ